MIGKRYYLLTIRAKVYAVSLFEDKGVDYVVYKHWVPRKRRWYYNVMSKSLFVDLSELVK